MGFKSRCLACDKEVDRSASICPHCGRDRPLGGQVRELVRQAAPRAGPQAGANPWLFQPHVDVEVLTERRIEEGKRKMVQELMHNGIIGDEELGHEERQKLLAQLQDLRNRLHVLLHGRGVRTLPLWTPVAGWFRRWWHRAQIRELKEASSRIRDLSSLLDLSQEPASSRIIPGTRTTTPEGMRNYYSH